MISIFAQPPYFLRHLQRVSTTIRGEQVAAYMHDARLNPESGYENDVCIYVKPNVKPGMDFRFEGRPYLDVLDGFNLVHLLRRYPDVPAIVFSELDVETMSRHIKNKIYLIPHHHVNFERIKREPRKVRKIGIVGSYEAFNFVPDEIKRGIAERGMELVEFSTFYPRMSVSHFYKKVDLGLVWRPYKKDLSNPFKIVNFSSFGIPTIALDEPAFKEMDGCYRPVHTIEEFFTELDALRTSQTLYDDIAGVCLEKAERYHISNIAELYRQLP